MSAIDTTTLQSLLNEVVEVLLDAYGAGVFPFGWDWDTESILCVRPRRSQPGTGSVEMACNGQEGNRALSRRAAEGERAKSSRMLKQSLAASPAEAG
jgi:hypothetical protein